MTGHGAKLDDKKLGEIENFKKYIRLRGSDASRCNLTAISTVDGAPRLDYALEEIEDARESTTRLNFATGLIRVPYDGGKAFTYLHRCNEPVEEQVLSNKNDEQYDWVCKHSFRVGLGSCNGYKLDKKSKTI